MKEIDEVELYIMYLINKIEQIEEKEVRKDIYGMFLIHQEKCEVNEVYDLNNEINFHCPCQDIISFIQKLNFHILYNSSKNKNENKEKEKEKDENLEKEKLIQADDKKSLISSNLKEDPKSKLNASTIKPGSAKRETPKGENERADAEIGHEDNSENKAMKVIKF